MIKSFIDTNIFVHWIILTNIKNESQDKDLWIKFKKFKKSYELLEKIKNNTLDDFAFYTSPLSLSEIFYALFDEIRCKKMSDDGLPLSSWQGAKNRFNLTEEEMNEVTNDVLNFANEFDLFTPLKTTKKINLLTNEHVEYSLISQLVMKNKFRTHDAILLSAAINVGCKYFTTKDAPIRKVELEDIEIISPEKMLQLIK